MLKQLGVGALTVLVAGLVGTAYMRTESAASSMPPSLHPVAVGPTASPSPTPGGVVSVIGDGYSSGSSMNSGPQTLWTAKLAADLSVQIQQLAVVGTGYLTKNSTTSSRTTMAERATKVDRAASVVVFFGGGADVGVDSSALRSTATRAFEAAAKQAPGARIVVVGPAREGQAAPQSTLENRDSLQRAALAADAIWVDPIDAKWFPPGSSLIGSDGEYPTDAGERRIAKLIKPAIEKALDH